MARPKKASDPDSTPTDYRCPNCGMLLEPAGSDYNCHICKVKWVPAEKAQHVDSLPSKLFRAKAL